MVRPDADCPACEGVSDGHECTGKRGCARIAGWFDDRSALLDHWKPDMPEERAAAMLRAWQERRACADCRWWEIDPMDGDTPTSIRGCCDAPSWRRISASFIVPADHSCDEFTPAPEPVRPG